jgi:hypothetical protein
MVLPYYQMFDALVGFHPIGEAVPASEPDRTSEGILIAPLADLVRMKLTSYRLSQAAR